MMETAFKLISKYSNHVIEFNDDTKLKRASTVVGDVNFVIYIDQQINEEMYIIDGCFVDFEEFIRTLKSYTLYELRDKYSSTYDIIGYRYGDSLIYPCDEGKMWVIKFVDDFVFMRFSDGIREILDESAFIHEASNYWCE